MTVGKKRGRASALARGAESPVVGTLAASAALAAGVGAAAKLAAGRGNPPDPDERKRRYRLEPGESPKQGVSRVAHGELDLTLGLLEAAPNGDDGAEAIHEARKALKRLRTLLRVSRPALKERRYRQENVALRDAGRNLSDARDAQVLLETLDSLLTGFGDELPPRTWRQLRKRLAKRAERVATNDRSDFEPVLDVLDQARRRVSSWPLPSENGRASLAEGFEQIYRRGRRALRRAEGRPTPENLHELRKRAKDLWHSTQLLQPVCPDEMKALSKQAHRLSDLLGDDHDLSVLLKYADQHSKLLNRSERRLLRGAVDLRRQVLRTEARACATELYACKPAQMLRRLSLA